MENTKHTKGPWAYLKLEDGSFAIKESDLFKNGQWQFSDRICTLEHYTNDNGANSKLIAASPELLEALNTLPDPYNFATMQEWLEHYDKWVAETKTPIIKKATE